MAEVVRVERNKNYTVMANYHFRDRRLSYKAIGLLSFMLNVPLGWDYSISGLAQCATDGIDSVRSGMRELEKYGYVVRQQVKDKLGMFTGVEYIIYEQPQTKTDTE